ncbi:hypothetical protein A2U01_0057683, partial [Trifolium medium]|nr:hypothetical protein [Trifolium medium]
RVWIPDLHELKRMGDVAYELQIEDREVKHLRNKEIVTVKVVWGEPTGVDAT